METFCIFCTDDDMLPEGFPFHQFNITYYSCCLVPVWDHGVYMYVVYIWKWSSAHALGGVSGVASFITTDEQLQ